MKNLLEKISSRTRPSSYMDHRSYLRALHDEAKAIDPSYSYKRFSDDLGFGLSTVIHQIVSSYRPLSLKNAERICRALGLVSNERKYFLTLVALISAKTSARREELFAELLKLKQQSIPDEIDRDVLEYFSEWYHPVVWELIGAPAVNATEEYITGRIVPKLRAEQVRESLRLLLKLKLIVWSEDGKCYKQTRSRISSGHRVKGLALTSYHQNMIEHGKSALTRITGKRRDISAVTVNVSEEGAQKLRAMIHAFQLQLLDEGEKNGGDQIYQINMQLFPFTE